MEVTGLQLLRDEVERIFGQKIATASDCQNLSTDIFKQTRQKISLNTLRRFFNLMTSKYQPSTFTLNLLANYCGFPSVEKLITHKTNVSEKVVAADPDLLNFLILLFRDFNTRGIDDTTYINLAHEIINNLEKWPHIIDEFQSEIAKTTNGQFFYYEQSVNMDKLNGYYGEGLRYYLHERKDAQAQIFGHSLLCLRSWLTMQKDEVYRHCQELIPYNIDETIHPSVCGRYFAAHLYQAEIFDYDLEPVLAAAREYYSDTKYSKDIRYQFPYFEYILSEALILTQQYDEALFYIIEAIKKRTNHIPPYVDLKLFESIYLFHAIALKNTGRAEKAKEMFEMISVNNFYFLSKKFNMILFLSQKQSFHKNELLKSQLNYLIQQTGFIKLISGYTEVFAKSVHQQ